MIIAKLYRSEEELNRAIILSRETLGVSATKALYQKRVTQVIRARQGNTGLAEVFLAKTSIGKVLVTEVDLVKFSDLDVEDARRCGFESLEGLHRSLKRMEYGLYSLEDCSGWKIRFTWDIPKEVLMLKAGD